jgi:tryptophan-rich sensory protein
MIKSWMAIAPITFLVSLGAILISPSDIKWFKQLRRPRWLTFEALIPVIWTVILICGGISAYLVWEAGAGGSIGWLIMAFYLLLEIAIIAYIPITLRSRNLKLGTFVGLVGFGLGILLALAVWQISAWAVLLLGPYLLWSPIGSYTTWAIARLNR